MHKKEFFLHLLNELLTPAYGCTEIGAVALACSVASEQLKSELKNANVWVSAYIYRNDANVGVPNMGKVGISTIAAAGFVTKNSVMKLSVLSKITNQQVIKAKKIAKKIDVQIAKNCNPVYVKVLATDKLGNVCDVLIEEEHDYIKQVKFNNKLVNIDGKIINNSQQHIQYNVNEITLNDIYHNIDLMNENDLMPLNKSIEMNRALVEYAKKNNCKFINISKKHDTWQDILTDLTRSISARMEGCPLPVMASCDSGDHGLTIALPQYVYHIKEKTSLLVMLKGVALANLITWKIKKNIGSLSAYCGSVIAAATGAIAGIGLQRNHSVKQINDLINYCLCSFAGSICDGAKLSCSWKVEAAMLAGFKAIEMVENKIILPHNEGLTNKDCFLTIKYLGNLSKTVMETTNNEIINIIKSNIEKK